MFKPQRWKNNPNLEFASTQHYRQLNYEDDQRFRGRYPQFLRGSSVKRDAAVLKLKGYQRLPLAKEFKASANRNDKKTAPWTPTNWSLADFAMANPSYPADALAGRQDKQVFSSWARST